MIKAIIRRKSNLFKSRYAFSRNRLVHGARRTQEDEIVAMMLGVLVYQPAIVVQSVMRSWIVRACRNRLASLDECISAGCTHRIRFWWRRNGTEPDVVIDFVHGDRVALRILVEAKWNSGESGDGQFQRQRKEFSSDAEGFLHLALIKSRQALPVKTGDSLSGVFRTTWAEYVASIADAQLLHLDSHPQLGELSDDLQELLGFLGLVSEFCGFRIENLPLTEGLPSKLSFYSPWTWPTVPRDSVSIASLQLFKRSVDDGRIQAGV